MACVLPDEEVFRARVLPGIAHVKANRLAEAAVQFRAAIESLLRDGAAIVVLGCTEIPAAFAVGDPWLAERCVDANDALARATVAWALAARNAAQTSKSRPRAR